MNLELIALCNILAYFVFGIIRIARGLDLKKWISWLFGLYGFFSGFLFVFINNGSVSLSIKVGVGIGLSAMFTGAMTRWNRQLFEKKE